MIPPVERAKSTLRAVIAYAKERDRWPDVDDLRAQCRRNLGSRSTVLRTLNMLRDNGLLELRGRTSASRWIATDAGFELVGRPKFTTVTDRQAARSDAALILASLNPKRTLRQSASARRSDSAPLEVYG